MDDNTNVPTSDVPATEETTTEGQTENQTEGSTDQPAA